MTMNRALGATALIVLFSTGAIAFADPIYSSSGQGTFNGQTSATMQIALPDAVAALEQKYNGRVLQIRYADASGHGIYDAVVAADGTVAHAQVDATTGQVVAVGDAMEDSTLDSVGQADVRSIAKADIPLSRAIETAEQAYEGQAVGAALAKPLSLDNRVLAYSVVIIRHGRAEHVAVDANTNEVIEDPEVLETRAP
jgi:uncharacterized membrane protein YkoI